MLIIDGDYPMAYGAIQLQRDLTLPIDQVRTRKKEAHLDTAWPDGGTMASLPEMRNARVAVALVKSSVASADRDIPTATWTRTFMPMPQDRGSSVTIAFWRPWEKLGYLSREANLATT